MRKAIEKGASAAFEKGEGLEQPENQALIGDLYLQIGQLTVERYFPLLRRSGRRDDQDLRLPGRLRSVLPAAAVQLHYAIKANPMPAVIAELIGLVDGVDVASGLELQAALDAGVDPAHVGFAGPGKTDAELSQAIAAGIVIELESEGEMRRAAAIAARLGVRPRVAVRVNPDFRLKGAGMYMAGGPSQFGVDAEAVPALLAELAGLLLAFVGFHIFAGSQNLNGESLIQAEAAIVELAIRLPADAPAPVRHLNIGGGFGVPYFPKDGSLDVAAVGRALHPLAERVARELPQARLVIELGRYLVAEGGST